MVYQPNIPLASDLLSKSQGDILGNFQTANTIFGINHYPFDDLTANKGKHKFVVMPRLMVIPPGLTNNEGTLYTKNNGVNTNLYYTDGPTTNEYQLTAVETLQFAKFATNTALPSANGNGGWTFLPGGLLLQYGSFNPNTSTTVQFPRVFNVAPFSLTLTGEANTNSTFRANIDQGSVTTTQFVFEGSISTDWTPIYFIAIGTAP